MEERSSAALTPFHVALEKGRVSALKYILEAHSPEDNEGIYDAPPSKSLLFIALESCQPEVVWMVLNNKLATKEDMANAWSFVLNDAQGIFRKTPGLAKPDEKVEEITNLLITFGGFSKESVPAPVQDTTFHTNGQASSTSPPLSPSGEPVSPQSGPPPKRSSRNRKPHASPSGSKEPYITISQPTTGSDEPLPSPTQNGPPPSPHGRGRGRGWSRGRGRGRGFRGRGRGGPPPL